MIITEKIRKKAQKFDSDSPVKIAFIGDSVTHGCFEVVEKQKGNFDCIYDHYAVYHARLKDKIESVFPNCSINIINAGISGGSAPQGAERVERDIISASPDLTVVCFGLNDVLGGKEKLDIYISALDSIFDKLNAKNIETIFMTPNMMCTYPIPTLDGWIKGVADNCSKMQNDGVLDLYINEAKKLCKEKNVTVCDCYMAWKKLADSGADIPWLLANHVNHPTREMHELFANMLFNTIFEL